MRILLDKILRGKISFPPIFFKNLKIYVDTKRNMQKNQFFFIFFALFSWSICIFLGFEKKVGGKPLSILSNKILI